MVRQNDRKSKHCNATMVHMKEVRKLQLKDKNTIKKMNGEVCDAKLKQTLRLLG